jgi:hypothetical protein
MMASRMGAPTLPVACGKDSVLVGCVLEIGVGQGSVLTPAMATFLIMGAIGEKV